MFGHFQLALATSAPNAAPKSWTHRVDVALGALYSWTMLQSAVATTRQWWLHAGGSVTPASPCLMGCAKPAGSSACTCWILSVEWHHKQRSLCIHIHTSASSCV